MKLPFQLDRYTLVELIGAGAFGQVYRAEVRGDMGFVSDFAVKVLDSNVVISNPNVARQMADEARLLSQLDHPNIVKVIDFKHEDHEYLGDVYYMVMEHVRGVDVSEILERIRLRSDAIPATAVLHMGLMVADALAHAHQMVGRDGQQLAIVHRDLKPQNLMVNFRGQVKVLDFGIAKAKDDRLAARTQEGQTKGTVFYMSPEQLTGDELDGRADIYSLASILFELLLGRRLLDVEVATPADLARAMHTAFEMDIDKRLAELRSHLNTDACGALPEEAVDGWIALLRAALQKDPRYRPDSASVFSEQLEWLRARHPAAMDRNFWAREAVEARETASGSLPAVVEELPDDIMNAPGLPTASDFFGMESGSVADEEMPAAAASRPELPPAEVPATRAMSVVSGTVRAFGSDQVRQLGGYQPLQPLPPIGGQPPQHEEIDLEEAELDQTGDAPSVAQTLETEAHKPVPAGTTEEVDEETTVEGADRSDEEPTMVYQAPKAERSADEERTMPYRAGPTLAKKTAVETAARRPRKKARGPDTRILVGIAAFMFLAILVLSAVVVKRVLGLGDDEPVVTQPAPSKSDAAAAAKSAPPPATEPATPAEAAAEGEGAEAAEGEGAEGEGAEGEGAEGEGAEGEDGGAAAGEGPDGAEGEAVAAAEPSTPEATPAPRAEPATPRPRPAPSARTNPPKRTERTSGSSSASSTAAAEETGILHLSARPRCRVEIDGKAYGTTDETRKGVRLPPGTYVVRFVCDDADECASFAKRSGRKTLKVEAGKETRYLADFYALQSRN